MLRPSLVCFLIFFALSAQAQTPAVDEILQSLTNKGYRVIAQERTWLGRERIVVENKTHRRELVFNPGTGEILRDYAVLLTDNGGASDFAVETKTTDPVAMASPPTVDLDLSDPVVTHDLRQPEGPAE